MSITLDGTNGITTPDVDSTTSVTTPLVTSSGALALSTTSANAIIASTNGVERMRIDSAGNVGIGTTSPDARLEVKDSDLAELKISSSNRTTGNLARLVFVDSTGTGRSSIQAISSDLIFTTNEVGIGGERMRIDSAGNIGIGTSSPTGRVSIRPTSGLPTLQVRAGSATGDTRHGIQIDWSGFYWGASSQVALNIVDSRNAAATDRQVQFSKGGNVVGNISCSLTNTSYNTSSDYRLKEDVQPVVNPVDRLKQLKPVNFAWKVDGSRVDGFLAHEAQEVVPESVTGEKDAVDKDGNPVYQGIDQSKLVPLLTAALQEALQKIDDLTARITALETAND